MSDLQPLELHSGQSQVAEIAEPFHPNSAAVLGGSRNLAPCGSDIRCSPAGLAASDPLRVTINIHSEDIVELPGSPYPKRCDQVPIDPIAYSVVVGEFLPSTIPTYKLAIVDLLCQRFGVLNPVRIYASAGADIIKWAFLFSR